MNIEKLRLVIDNNQIALDLADDRACPDCHSAG
ncbi:MAG: hypothetical protein RL695_234 [Pseudomonadota bacterium]|jgi:hypothetical protein